ncbi:SRPBCC family protein [Endozoicomonas numazuensis]|uniref:Uncharacterized protein n=1 Tax=Endozoicomonas numazuensis TaxID=1137799 RepID=A0A081NCS8_9GAMM|nr:hypothetical protein [Endozoicomonas numazuensis]KEQ16251.1 hypothetical protein GZ78_23845 [Endozoicomonas numazuensis]
MRLFTIMVFTILFPLLALAQPYTQLEQEETSSSATDSSNEPPTVKKPTLDVYLNEHWYKDANTDDIIYWHMDHPSLFAVDDEAFREDDFKDGKVNVSLHRSNMLEELPAFLSRKGIFPKVYIITGHLTHQNIRDFRSAVQNASYDSVVSRKENIWTYYASEGAFLVVSRYGFPSKEALLKEVWLDESLFGKKIHAGNMLAIKVKTDEIRSIDLMVYFSTSFNFSHLREQQKLQADLPDITRHPVVAGLEQALMLAKEKGYGSISPLVVAGNTNIPLFPEVNNGFLDHMQSNLHLHTATWNKKSPVVGSFNTMNNTISSFWLGLTGGPDYLLNDSVSELIDWIAISGSTGLKRPNIKMKAVEFESVCRYSMPIQKICGQGYSLKRQVMLNKAVLESTILDNMPEEVRSGAEEKVLDYVVNAPSGHHPIHAKLTHPDLRTQQQTHFCEVSRMDILDLKSVTGLAPITPDEEGTIDLALPPEIIKKVFEFAEQEMMPDSEVNILMDRQQNVYALPVRAGPRDCNPIVHAWSGDAGLGRVVRTQQGKIQLKEMMLRREKVDMWSQMFKQLSTSNPDDYAEQYFASGKELQKLGEPLEANGRTYTYYIQRRAMPVNNQQKTSN